MSDAPVTVERNAERVALVVEREAEGAAVTLSLTAEEARAVARQLATTASKVEPREIVADGEGDE